MAAEAATRVTMESIRESPSKPSWTELERKTKCLSARCVRACLVGGGFGGIEGRRASHRRATYPSAQCLGSWSLAFKHTPGPLTANERGRTQSVSQSVEGGGGVQPSTVRACAPESDLCVVGLVQPKRGQTKCVRNPEEQV